MMKTDLLEMLQSIFSNGPDIPMESAALRKAALENMEGSKAYDNLMMMPGMDGISCA